MSILPKSLPTLDTVVGEVTIELLRHYLSYSGQVDRRHHIACAIVGGARLLVGKLVTVNDDFWGCVEDIDDVLQAQETKGVTHEILAMVKAAVAVACAPIQPQRYFRDILAEDRPHLVALSHLNIDVIVEELTRLRRGESRFVDQAAKQE